MILLDYPIKCFNWTMNMRLSNYLLAVIVRNAKSGMVSATQKSPLLSGKAKKSIVSCAVWNTGGILSVRRICLAGVNPHQHQTDHSVDS